MYPIVDIKCSKCEKSYYANSDGVFAPSCVCDKYPNVEDGVICAVCPVCQGKGTVRTGFYKPVEGFTTYGWTVTGSATTGTVFYNTPETCRSCGGTGVVWKV